MARPKSFDREETLQGAVEIFRAKGYEATSIQDLVDHLGVNRQSLYDTFGDKDTLYREALARYRALNPAPLAALLNGPLPLRRALGEVFHRTAAHLLSPGGLPCLLVHAALERAAGDPAVAACVRGGFQDNQGLIERRLRRAQAEGELGPQQDPAALAAYFQNTLQGLQVSARSGATAAELNAIVRVTLSVLG